MVRSSPARRHNDRGPGRRSQSNTGDCTAAGSRSRSDGAGAFDRRNAPDIRPLNGREPVIGLFAVDRCPRLDGWPGRGRPTGRTAAIGSIGIGVHPESAVRPGSCASGRVVVDRLRTGCWPSERHSARFRFRSRADGARCLCRLAHESSGLAIDAGTCRHSLERRTEAGARSVARPGS
jgi:hypothetical protein